MSAYVYGITFANHTPAVDGMAGVGVAAPPLRVLRRNDLAAVVSDAPAEVRAKRRDLERHHGVLAALAALGPVVPMRFGVLASDDAAVLCELESAAGRFRELLARVQDRIELNVKAAHRESAVLRDLLLQHPTLRDRHEALRASGGGRYEERVAFGERIAEAMADRRARDADRVLAALRPHAVQVRLAPAADGCFVNASFLVPAARRQEFEDSLSHVRQAFSTLGDVRMQGPLPPYSFVTLDEEHEWTGW